MKITGIILAGGLGTRMEKICRDIPKALLEFNGVPFLFHQVCWLMRYCDEIIIAAGHNPSGISSIFSQEVWKRRGVKVVGEVLPLGTGGAIRLAASQAASNVLFICNGDTVVSDVNVAEIVRSHVFGRLPITAVLTKNEDFTVQNRGAITLQGKLVIGFEEGHGDKKINFHNASSTGCYVMNREFILQSFPAPDGRNYRELSLERELLPLFAATSRLKAFIMRGNRYFIDFGKPNCYELLVRKKELIPEIYGKIY
jgi:D-glycero-alpha-D-manno-heptose 1-phosphate guanylyltransferase